MKARDDEPSRLKTGRKFPATFYTVALRRCPCGKPATQDVRGKGGVSYGQFCDVCGRRHVKELTDSHARTSR